MSSPHNRALSALDHMAWEDDQIPRVMYMWEYNGRLIVSGLSRMTLPGAELDTHPHVLSISTVGMYPDYGSLIRKKAWFRSMCGYFKIQLIEE